MKKIKCAVVGLGMISKFFIAAINHSKISTLEAVCDFNPKKFKSIPKKIQRYSNFSDMLRQSDIDVIIITLPNHLHHKFIKQAILAKKHVLCEKPLTIKPEDAKEVIKLAKENNILLTTAYHRRYNKYLYPFIKDSSKLGKIKYIRSTYFEDIIKHSYNKKWYKDINKCGGGCIIDNGTNMIDIFLKLVNKLKIKDILIGYKKEGKYMYDNNAIIEFEFDGGNAILELDWSYKGERKEVIIVTTKGIFHIDFLENFKGFKSSLWHEYDLLFNEFIRSIKSKTYDMDSESKVVEIISKAYKKIHTIIE